MIIYNPGSIIFQTTSKENHYIRKRITGMVWDDEGRPIYAWRVQNTRHARKILRIIQTRLAIRRRKMIAAEQSNYYAVEKKVSEMEKFLASLEIK
jgi:hypothetical protein